MLKKMDKLLSILYVSFLLIAVPIASADNLEVECDYPGQLAEAGDILEFDLMITNYANISETYDLSYSINNGDDWTINFKDGDDIVSKVYTSAWSTRYLTLSVETPGDADVGEYPIYVRVGNGKLNLNVEITKTHKDEKGSLNLKVTNRDGDNIKGANVSTYEADELVYSVKTTSEGKISLELPKGEYNAEISKEGYHPTEIDDFKIKIGRVKDLGIFSLEQKEYYADVSSNVPSKTANIGANPKYQVSIHNIGKMDDTYGLFVKGLPEGWYARFRESDGSNNDISSIFIPSSDEKTLFIEFVPPYDVKVGEYKFIAVVSSSNDQFYLNLNLSLKGSYMISLYPEKLMYNVYKGDTISTDLRVSNSGLGGTITLIKPEISAPEGWGARVSPKEVTSMGPGDSEVFLIKITPPVDIATDDYRVTINVKSDQLEESVDYRIVVRDTSNIPLYGLLIVIAALASLFVMFRKYGRR